MNSFHKYFKAFELGLQTAMEYRVNFILSLLSCVFPMVMQAFLWKAIFNNSSSSIVYGYDYPHMLTYIIIAGIVSKLIDTSVKWEISSDIKEGGLNKFIVRPVGYLPFRIFSFLGQKALQLSVVLVILTFILTAVNVKLKLSITFIRVLLFIAAILLALLLNLFLAFIVSSSAFWMTEAWGAFMFTDIIINLASGGMFPLDILGNKAMQFINLLPFKYIIYFPTNILNGKLSLSEIGLGLFMQCFWIAIMFGFTKLSWHIGLKKYIAIGG